MHTIATEGATVINVNFEEEAQRRPKFFDEQDDLGGPVSGIFSRRANGGPKLPDLLSQEIVDHIMYSIAGCAELYDISCRTRFNLLPHISERDLEQAQGVFFIDTASGYPETSPFMVLRAEHFKDEENGQVKARYKLSNGYGLHSATTVVGYDYFEDISKKLSEKIACAFELQSRDFIEDEHYANTHDFEC